MSQKNLAIRLCHLIKRKKWCFQLGGACGTCGSYRVVELLKQIDAQKLETSLLAIDETTAFIFEYAEDINILISFFGKFGRVQSHIDIQAIKNNWQKNSQNTANCIYTIMLKGKPMYQPPKKKNKTKYSFDGRAKYNDSEEEILIREGWYNR